MKSILPDSATHNYIIPNDHPCLAGHFPGTPIVPGVILLDYARRLLKQWKPEAHVTGISHAKFHRPLLPEQSFSIQLTDDCTGTIKFECRSDTDKLASGTLIVETLA